MKKLLRRINNKKGELGIGTIIGVALAIIIAGFVLIPGMRTFAQSVMTSMNNWWLNTVETTIFPTALWTFQVL